MTKSIAAKADEILLEGLLHVEQVQRFVYGRVIAATCLSRTEEGKSYTLGFNPRSGEWFCNCPAPRTKFCSHLVALQRVTTRLSVRHD